MQSSSAPERIVLLAALVAALWTADAALGQDEEKIRALFENAIRAMGGETYTKVTDAVTEGNYFAFDREGNSSGLIKYNDWTKFPDKSRNETGNKKKARDVVVFNLEKNEGWILEGQKDTRDATPDDMRSFRNAVKHSIDNILRWRWKDPANKLFYLGPGEGRDVQYDQVQVLDPENDTVTVYFDRVKHLPKKIEYKEMSGRGVPLRHVEEYDQWHVIQGVNVPMRIDNLVNGRKSSVLYVVTIMFNTGIPDSFFAKPIPPK